jgi:hypothetical protein
MDRPRLIRGLRIAWSVWWGILCVLLVVLWARSYRRVDTLDNLYGYRIAVKQGKLVLGERAPQPPIFSPRLPPVTRAVARFLDTMAPMRVVVVASIPLGILVAIGSLLTAAPWILPLSRLQRFSLRTLLIATTLVAVVLGVVVWSMNS